MSVYERVHIMPEDLDVSTEESRFREKCCIVLHIVVVTAILFFSGIATYVAEINTNMTCYEHSKIMTLSNYVMVNATSYIFSGLILLSAMVWMYVTETADVYIMMVQKTKIFRIVVLVTLFLIVSFLCALGIGGSFELIHSYSRCYDEIGILCIFSMIFILMDFLVFIYFVYRFRNDNE